jgi:hypothetical protein
MIENFRAHPYTRAVCLEAARLFEKCAAKHLVEAHDSADRGAANSALQFQAKTRLAQQHASSGICVRKMSPPRHRAFNLDDDDVLNAG